MFDILGASCYNSIMKTLKESKQERAARIATEEGGRRFRSKVWSKPGKGKCPKEARRKANENLRNVL